MQSIELRPMGIGDILDTAFRLYRARFLTFLTIVLIAYVPYALGMAFLASAVQPVDQGEPSILAEDGDPYVSEPMMIGDDARLGFMITAVVLFFVLMFIVMPLCQGALIHNISAAYLGESIGAGTSYKRALPRLGRLLLANILVGIIVVIGFLLLIVPGVIFSLWFMLTTAVVMLESHGVTGSLGRSRELMRGNLGKGFLIGLMVAVMAMVFGGIAGALLAVVPWPSPFVEMFATQAVSALIVPMQLAPIILLYYDLRIRKEGFDMERLAASLETARTESRAVPGVGERGA